MYAHIIYLRLYLYLNDIQDYVYIYTHISILVRINKIISENESHLGKNHNLIYIIYKPQGIVVRR